MLGSTSSSLDCLAKTSISIHITSITTDPLEILARCEHSLYSITILSYQYQASHSCRWSPLSPLDNPVSYQCTVLPLSHKQPCATNSANIMCTDSYGNNISWFMQQSSLGSMALNRICHLLKDIILISGADSFSSHCSADINCWQHHTHGALRRRQHCV